MARRPERGLYRAFTGWLDWFMEEYGYAAIGFAVLIGVPAGLYWAYFNQISLSELRPVEGTVTATRVVDTTDGDGDRTTYFEISFKEHAVPVRIHRPSFDPDDEDAPLRGDPGLAAGSRAAVHVHEEGLGKLKEAPKYPPWRWVEGYSLRSGGKTFLLEEDAMKVYRADRKIALYLANAFVLAYVGIFGFLVVQGLESSGKRVRAPPVDKAAAEGVSKFYYAFIPGLLFLNLPAIALSKPENWRWDAGFWWFFAACVAGLQALMVLHHRRYLSIFDSNPRDPDEEPGGFFAYLILDVVLCFMITPAIQWLYALTRSGG